MQKTKIKNINPSLNGSILNLAKIWTAKNLQKSLKNHYFSIPDHIYCSNNVFKLLFKFQAPKDSKLNAKNPN